MHVRHTMPELLQKYYSQQIEIVVKKNPSRHRKELLLIITISMLRYKFIAVDFIFLIRQSKVNIY